MPADPHNPKETDDPSVHVAQGMSVGPHFTLTAVVSGCDLALRLGELSTTAEAAWGSASLRGVGRCVAVWGVGSAHGAAKDPEPRRMFRVAVGNDAKYLELFDVHCCVVRGSFAVARVEPVATLGQFAKRPVSLSLRVSHEPQSHALFMADKFGVLLRFELGPDGTAIPAGAAGGADADEDAATGGVFVLQHQSILCAVAAEDAKWLATADRDGNLRVSSAALPADVAGYLWRPKGQEQVPTTAAHIGVTFAPDNRSVQRWLFAGGLDGSMALFDLDRRDIDGSAAFAGTAALGDNLVLSIDAPCSHPIITAAAPGGVRYAAVDGVAALKCCAVTPQGALVAVPEHDVALPAPPLSVAGTVAVLRDGTLCSATHYGVEVLGRMAERLPTVALLADVAVDAWWNPARKDPRARRAAHASADEPAAQKAAKAE